MPKVREQETMIDYYINTLLLLISFPTMYHAFRKTEHLFEA